MSIQESIREKLQAAFQPTFLKIENESDQHRGPSGRETHFYLVIVSPKFTGLSRVERQRQVYATLAAELASGVHALTQKTFTPEEWKARGEQEGTGSPACGGAHE